MDVLAGVNNSHGSQSYFSHQVDPSSGSALISPAASSVISSKAASSPAQSMSASSATSVGRVSSPEQEADPRRKHRCATCSKAFTTSGHLSRHVKIHTGERSHKCPFPGCTTTCSRQDNLQQHYRIHLSPVAKRVPGGRNGREKSPRERSADPTIADPKRRKRSRREPAVVPIEESLSLTSNVPAPPPSPPLTPPPLERASMDVLMGLRAPRVLPSQQPPTPIYNAQHVASPEDATAGPSMYPAQHQQPQQFREDGMYAPAQGYYPSESDPRYAAYGQPAPAPIYPQQYPPHYARQPQRPPSPVHSYRPYAHSASPAPVQPSAHDSYGASRYPSPSSTGEQPTPGNEYPRGPEGHDSRYASPMAYEQAAYPRPPEQQPQAYRHSLPEQVPTHPAYRAGPTLPSHADTYRAPPHQPQYAPAPMQQQQQQPFYAAHAPPPHDYRVMAAPAPDPHGHAQAQEPVRRSTLPGLASLLPPPGHAQAPAAAPAPTGYAPYHHPHAQLSIPGPTAAVVPSAPSPPVPAMQQPQQHQYGHLTPPPAIQVPLTSYLNTSAGPQTPQYQQYAPAPGSGSGRTSSPAIVLPPLQGPGTPSRIALPPIQARAW